MVKKIFVDILPDHWKKQYNYNLYWYVCLCTVLLGHHLLLKHLRWFQLALKPQVIRGDNDPADGWGVNNAHWVSHECCQCSVLTFWISWLTLEAYSLVAGCRCCITRHVWCLIPPQYKSKQQIHFEQSEANMNSHRVFDSCPLCNQSCRRRCGRARRRPRCSAGGLWRWLSIWRPDRGWSWTPPWSALTITESLPAKEAKNTAAVVLLFVFKKLALAKLLKIKIFDEKSLNLPHQFAVAPHALNVSHSLNASEKAELWQVVLWQKVLINLVLQAPACANVCRFIARQRNFPPDGETGQLTWLLTSVFLCNTKC